jgi:hypothetical protein
VQRQVEGTYSVPPRHVGDWVTLRASPTEIRRSPASCCGSAARPIDVPPGVRRQRTTDGGRTWQNVGEREVVCRGETGCPDGFQCKPSQATLKRQSANEKAVTVFFRVCAKAGERPVLPEKGCDNRIQSDVSTNRVDDGKECTKEKKVKTCSAESKIEADPVKTDERTVRNFRCCH